MHIKLKDNKSFEIPEGSTAKDLADKLNLKGPTQALGASINGINTDLSHPLKDGDQVVLWGFEDPEGREMFWHTSAHVLAQAILRLWPTAKPTIGPPIENGFYYDFANLTISEDDFPKLEEEVKKVIAENYETRREVLANKKEALSQFANNKYKKELIEGLTEDQTITAYRQGEFYDLCRGPHLPNLGKIKAFKVLKTSGAYWKGDSKNEMLTRVYAISFPDRLMLKEYLERLEEAKKRDHKILGPKLDLFSLKEEAPGMPFIHPKGMLVWNTLIDFWRELHRKANYVEIKTPSMMTKALWEISGHWAHYRQNMFISQIEDQEYAIKPMNCPGACLFYRGTVHSYRDLPKRVAELGHVHRYEPSGALSGLFRVRSFHQDDAHVYMKPEDIESEIIAVLNLANQIYSTFGLQYHLELSTRPKEGTIGSDEIWEKATAGLKGALDHIGRPYRINEGDGAFYGPKIDMHIRDALGRTWQCGTVQLDMALPEQFQLEYTSADGSRHRPIMIHRAIFGSMERFFGILIEHFAGRFPLWLSPRQVRILGVADRHMPYAEEILKKLKAAKFNVEVDGSHESMGKKVRNAQLDQVNYILTVGDQEMANKTINVRTRDNVVHGEVDLDSFITALNKEKSERALESSYKKD
jgi:threonyl-tRNA synthetase